MKKRLHYIGIITIAMVMFSSTHGFTQELEPGEVLPELSTEQKMERLTGNLNAMVFAAMNFAVKHDHSIEEAGRYFGKVFANSWPDDATPEFYVSAMNNNWQMYDLQMEVLEVGDDYVTARRDRIPFSDESEEAFQEMYGYGRSDFETFFLHIEKGITSELDLTLTQRNQDEHVEFTVSANP